MQTTPFQRPVKAADLPLDRLLSNHSIPEREKLQAASRAFEAVLLRQILENAQKPLIKSGATPENSTSAVYRDLVTTQLADSIAKSGQFGLARSLDQQWQQQLGTPAATAPTVPGQPPAAAPKLKPLHSTATLKPLFHNSDLKVYHHE